jgi:RNA polymerase sigma factor (sigma-70 family)
VKAFSGNKNKKFGDKNMQEIVKEKIAECMNKIFAFSLSRTDGTSDAEDLSQQIIVELLSSAGSVKNIDAFYGWMWAVARNVYGKYLRSLKKEKDARYTGDFYELALPDKKTNVEDEIILAGDISVLKRELAILSRKYREAVVKYYFEDKSCAQISKELAVTVETVKNLLFKARKILKEGINMNREFGEKSYNPGVLRLDKWLKSGWLWEELQKLTDLFEQRKLPGNILLSAYYEPLTIEEMSVELGVAAAYLEDEVKILLDAELLKLMQNGRYQTNIFIFTTACQEDIILKTKELYRVHAQKLSSFVDGKISEVQELAFKDSGFSQNKIKWFLSHFILWHSAAQNKENLNFPDYNGRGEAYFWGYNHEYFEYDHGFNGIYGKGTSEHYEGWIHASNYKLLEKCQPRIGGGTEKDFLLAAAHKSFERFAPDEIAQYLQGHFIEKDGDSYKSLCPVMTQAQYDELCEICSSEIKEINTELSETLSVIAKVMQNHAPAAVQSQIKDIAAINISFKNMAYIIQNLCDTGYLSIPMQRDFLTVYAVI